MLVHFIVMIVLKTKCQFDQKSNWKKVLKIYLKKKNSRTFFPLSFGLLAQFPRSLPFFLGRGPAGPLPPLLPSHPLTGQACLSAPSSPSRRACEAGFNAFEKMKRIFFYCASGKFGEVAECFLREKHSPNAVLREIGPSIERCTRRALCVR